MVNEKMGSCSDNTPLLDKIFRLSRNWHTIVKLYPAVICFCVFVFIYGVTSRSDIQSSDEIAIFGTAISLATRGSFDVDQLRWMRDNIYPGKTGRDNHLYSRYFPGNSVASAFLYSIAARKNDQPYTAYVWDGSNFEWKNMAPSNQGARFALRLNAILGALGMAALFALIRKQYDIKTAFFSVLLIGLASDWWYQSRIFFSEIGAGAFLILGLYFSISKKPWHTGLMLAISFIFRPTNIVALPVWIYSIWRKERKYLWSILFPLLGVGSLLLYNYIRFNSLWDFGDLYTIDQFHSHLLAGFVWILLSPGRGIFFYSPVSILAIPGSKLLFRKNKILFVLCTICVVLYLLLIAKWGRWDGGTVWGSRLLTPIIPVIGIFLAPVINLSFKNKNLRNAVIFLGIAGLCLQLLTIIQNPFPILINEVESGHVSYTDTLLSFRNNWFILQLKGLSDWNVCRIDSYTLRNLFAPCP
jgi:hypothetical protein